MDNLFYLVSAYSLLWIVVFGYVFSIFSKQKTLNAEVERLKSQIDGKK